MKAYVEAVHTPKALEDEVNRIYAQYPGALIVGSLGRAATFNGLGLDADIEFQERGQDPLFYDGVARDIDVILTAPSTVEEGPFDVDQTVFDGPRVRIVRDGTDWFLVSDRKKFQAQLHEAVMEPVVGQTVHGIEVVTVPVQTHAALFGLKGLMGVKVTKSRELTMRAASLSEDDMLNGIYKPFAQLKALDQRGIYPFLQRYYRALLPEPMRVKMDPLIRPLKQLLP
jgi:hypothetical protein